MAILSTGDIRRDYEILDVVFAADSYSQGLFSSSDPNKAFQGVKIDLTTKCASLGGDAVINCHFEYRGAQSDGLMSKKPTMEIFAYGTVVKYL